MKKAVIVPDSFKGTLSSLRICELIEKTLTEKYRDIECICIPVADGGEGTVDAFFYSLGGQIVTASATDPIGNEISAQYLILPDGTAVIETAQASGITLVTPLRPMSASTFGTGQLIKDALDRGCRKFLIGMGGSATTDGGTGCISALGGKFLNKLGYPVPGGGEGLVLIDGINMSCFDKRIPECEFTALSDVENVLFGKNGAAYVFGPQKGANSFQIKRLDDGLRKLSEKVFSVTHENHADAPGAGAAGGLGFALMSFLGAKTKSGINTVLDACGFDEKIKNADIIITGEGRMDYQSIKGKVPFGVAKRACGIPVTAVVGRREISRSLAREYGISSVIETNPNRLPMEEVKKHCEEQLVEAVKKIKI